MGSSDAVTSCPSRLAFDAGRGPDQVNSKANESGTSEGTFSELSPAIQNYWPGQNAAVAVICRQKLGTERSLFLLNAAVAHNGRIFFLFFKQTTCRTAAFPAARFVK